MMRYFLILIFIFLLGCSTMKQLKKYEGVDIAAVEKEMGKPTTIIPVYNGKLYIYETTKELEGTEISKGQTTLDPMLSPAAEKTEKIIFTVVDGKVKKVKKEIEYSRR